MGLHPVATGILGVSLNGLELIYTVKSSFFIPSIPLELIEPVNDGIKVPLLL